MSEQVNSTMQEVRADMDEATAHGECPEDVKGALLFKMKCGVANVQSNVGRVFRKDAAYDRYDFKVRYIVVYLSICIKSSIFGLNTYL